MAICWSCGRLTQSTTLSCWRCRLKQLPRLGKAHGKLLLATLFVICFGAGLVRLRPEWFQKGNNAQLGSSPEENPGWDRVRIQAESAVVPLAVDVATAEVIETIPSAKFGIGYLWLLRAGRVTDVPGNSPATIIEEEKTRVKVRVELNNRDVTGWLQRDWLKPRSLEFAPTLREVPEPVLPH